MNRFKASKILGDIGRNPSKDKLEQRYEEYRDFYYPLFFGPLPQVCNQEDMYKYAMAEGFRDQEEEEDVGYGDHMEYVECADRINAFLRFGQVCEAYHTLSGSKEWEHLEITSDTEDYLQYKRNYASKTNWHKFVSIAEKISHLNFLFLILTVVGLFTFLWGGFFEVVAYVGVLGFIATWLITVIAIPLDVLLFIPRALWLSIKESTGFFSLIFNPIFRLFFSILAFMLIPSSFFSSRKDRLRGQPLYEQYKNERLEKRYRKIMSEIDSLFPEKSGKMRAFAQALKVIETAKNGYDRELLLYMDIIRSERPAWDSILKSTEEELKELKRQDVKMDKKHSRQEKRDYRMAYQYVEVGNTTFDYFDEEYIKSCEKDREEERTALQEKIQKAEAVLRFKVSRLRTEAIIRFGIDDLGCTV